MKKIILVLFLAFFITSCEDVVQVDLKTQSPKLVIAAAINWYKGTTGNEQSIKLSTTANYYDNTIPVVSGAVIYVTNSAKKRYNFLEIPSTGEYVCRDFEPVIDETYTLTIKEGNNVYSASEILKSIAPITKLIQNNNGGITKDKIEVKAYFNDPPDQTNYYCYNYNYSNKVTGNYASEEDRFFNGNEFFSVSYNDDLKPGDQVEVRHVGISQNYFNYLAVLISLAGDSGRLPFQTPPVTIRGNILNLTNNDNYPLGYFSLSEVDSKKYTIK